MGALSSCSASFEGLLLLVRHSSIFCRVPGTKATPDNVSTVCPFTSNSSSQIYWQLRDRSQDVLITSEVLPNPYPDPNTAQHPTALSPKFPSAPSSTAFDTSTFTFLPSLTSASQNLCSICINIHIYIYIYIFNGWRIKPFLELFSDSKLDKQAWSTSSLTPQSHGMLA